MSMHYAVRTPFVSSHTTNVLSFSLPKDGAMSGHLEMREKEPKRKSMFDAVF